MARRLTDVEINEINRRTQEADLHEPRATAARFDPKNERLVVELRSGVVLMIPVHFLQGVAGGSHDAIADVEITPGGDGLHWERLDADLSVSGLAEGRYGNAAWMSHLFDQSNGGRTITAKSVARRGNGVMESRPRKKQGENRPAALS